MNQESITVTHDVIHLRDDDFESSVIHSNKPVLVDFWADWCQPCHQIAPTIEALSEEYGDRLMVAKMDVDANPLTLQRYDIRSIPSLLLFKDGQVVQRMVGVQPKEKIVSIIEHSL